MARDIWRYRPIITMLSLDPRRSSDRDSSDAMMWQSDRKCSRCSERGSSATAHTFQPSYASNSLPNRNRRAQHVVTVSGRYANPKDGGAENVDAGDTVA